MDLINFLKNKGISQTRLAQELGVTPSNVNLWVNGKGFPSYEMCRKLLEMGMLVEDLFDVDYRSMHDHDTYRSSVETKDNAGEKSFQEMFDEAMLNWIRSKAEGSL